MDIKYYVPKEMACRLALWGFNEECDRRWAVMKDRLLDDKSFSMVNWFQEADRGEHYPPNGEYRRGALRAYSEGLSLSKVVYRATACTYDQVKEFFITKYNIDFIERPHIGREKQYICDVVGNGLGDVRLEACKTPREALLQAFTFLLNKLQPLPCPVPEELEVEEDEPEQL